ncbi:hypothetical protein JHK82_026089 [Glycine max]|uniref:Uncharacterized protein n=1 Tax=Glycine soja TaxID=3848 RepID=A0A0B2QPS4_GLYSO|nr:hypothetical protein JHK87_026027 [Glycine soja]KAG5013954.1 hypothetical protein JHK86_026215 [Glycine max]KAG5134901.1 hypothetical protein JHK82_026089 [Glycine max]KHN22154.1 hypothetical protein glysoja_042911 [Glycine soja]
MKLIQLEGGKNGILQSFQNSSKMSKGSFSCANIFYETNNPVTLIISNNKTPLYLSLLLNKEQLQHKY